MHLHDKKSGFTLVELSIVLAILGLLVGGVLVGRSLIRAAELRSITNEFQQWQLAIDSFKLKYNALPGDMTNATTIWGNAETGVANGQCGAPLTDAGTGKQTCNGNGDGNIYYTWKGGIRSDLHEVFRFWQHLSNAELISGTYPGTGIAASSQYTITSAPPTKAGDGAFWGIVRLGGGLQPFWHEHAFGLTSNIDTSSDYNSLSLGILSNTDALHGAPVGGFLTPEEAWNIDMKMDDGKPGTGKVMATSPTYLSSRCTLGTRDDWGTAGYDLESSKTHCSLLFPRAF